MERGHGCTLYDTHYYNAVVSKYSRIEKTRILAFVERMQREEREHQAWIKWYYEMIKRTATMDARIEVLKERIAGNGRKIAESGKEIDELARRFVKTRGEATEASPLSWIDDIIPSIVLVIGAVVMIIGAVVLVAFFINRF